MSWYRFVGTLKDAEPRRDGTVSVFFEFNLWNWAFGFRIDPDPHWLTIFFDCGPLQLDFTYWRSPPMHVQ